MKIPEKPPKIDKIPGQENSKIFALLENKEVLASIIEYNKRYLHWDELKYKKLPENLKPEPIWVLLKMFRQQQSRFVKFNGWTFSYVLLDETLRKLHLLDKGAAGHLETGLEAVNTEGRDRYIISSLMEEAIASSQLEGAATTRKIAKEMLRLRKKPRNYSEHMIVNGYNTLEKIVKMKDKEITPEIILQIQNEITKDTLKDKDDSGRFRDNNDVVVGDPLEVEKVYHRPPDYKKVPELMDEFCKFASNDDHTFIHPVVKGIMLHFLIGYIHPFNDGNGRTARSVFYWYLLSRGYWLFEFMSVSRILLKSKRKYGLAYLYTETDENDLTYFINYNLSAIEEALNDMEEYIARKQKEQIEAMKLLQGIKDINLRQAEILKDFMKHPGKPYSIGEIMTTYGTAYDTARNDLLHLTQIGRLKKTKAKKKYLFQLISG
jgi:Fic family protein